VKRDAQPSAGRCTGAQRSTAKPFDSVTPTALPFGLAGASAPGKPITRKSRRDAPMEILFVWVGRLAGLGGVVLCAWAVYTRLNGLFFAGGFQIGTLLQAGITAILIGCLCLLIVLTNRPRR
jgi:hypothetical protein